MVMLSEINALIIIKDRIELIEIRRILVKHLLENRGWRHLLSTCAEKGKE